MGAIEATEQEQNQPENIKRRPISRFIPAQNRGLGMGRGRGMGSGRGRGMGIGPRDGRGGGRVGGGRKESQCRGFCSNRIFVYVF